LKKTGKMLDMKTALTRLIPRFTALLVLFSSVAFAVTGKVERIGALPAAGSSDALRQGVENKGYRVTLEDKWTAEFWFAKELKTEKKDVPGALYPELTDSEFVGIVRLPQGMSDYRGQSIGPGIYTLRYQLLPQDGDHMGVAPNPDFLLVSPAANDPRPEQAYPLVKLAAVSSRSTTTGHPGVIAMLAGGEPATVNKDERGDISFSVEIAVAGGAHEKLGIVIKGTAGQ
jgi:hypothetical protein